MHDISYLRDIIVLLSASVAIIIVFKQLGLSPVLGYLVAGTAIGPFGFGVLTSTETTKSIAELGIVFLLFAVGLELTLSKLVEMKKYILGFGGLQVTLTSLVISVICFYCFDLSLETSIVIGSALSLSSTAIVLPVLAENGEQSTRVGRLSFSILLMQDLAIVPILVLLPLLANPDINIGEALGGASLKAIITMATIFIVGRLFLRPLYRLIAEAKSDVLFLSFTLVIVLGSAFLSHMMGLSFALGAFIAGLMVAETEYKYRVEEEILSLKSLLMGLFFMSIGMSFDFDLLLHSFPYVALAALLLIFVKSSVIMILCKIFRFPTAPAFHTALLLSQGGELAFVIFLMAVQIRFMEIDLSQFLMTVVTVTMALTPLLATIGRKVKGRLYIKEVLKDGKLKREIGDISKHIIVIGFTRIGRIVANILRKQNVNYIVLENNHRIVKLEKENGYNIYYGDANNIDILRNIGIEKSESIIICNDDNIACLHIAKFIRDNFEHSTIFTKADSIDNANRLRKAGATMVVSKNLETALQLSNFGLMSVGKTHDQIEKVLDVFRDIDSDAVKEIIKYNETEKNF